MRIALWVWIGCSVAGVAHADVVWGSLGAGTRARPSKPEFRIGSLDSHPALNKKDCIKAAFPQAKGKRIGNDLITNTEQLGLTAETTICVIEHWPKDETNATNDIIAVARKTKTVLGRTQVELIKGPVLDITAPGGRSDDVKTGAVDLSAFPLTTTETALLVQVIQSTSGPFASSETNTSTLYRVSANGLDAILTLTSTSESSVEGGSSNRCKLEEPSLGPTVPKKLSLHCSSTKEDWHNEDSSLRGDNHAERNDSATWNGSTYDYTPSEP
jgi:hypothetical protein